MSQLTLFQAFVPPAAAPLQDALASMRRKLGAIGRELGTVNPEEHALLSRATTAAAAAPAIPAPGLLTPATAAPAGAAASPAPPQQQQQQRNSIVPLKLRPLEKKEARPEGSGEEILLQGFNWDSWKQQGGWWNHLAAQAEEIANLGATAIWLPPPTNSVSAEGYMPGDLYNLNSKYGSEEQLLRCVAALQAQGLKVLADAVLNHRCAQRQDESGTWNLYGGRLCWDQRAIVGEWGGLGAPAAAPHPVLPCVAAPAVLPCGCALPLLPCRLCSSTLLLRLLWVWVPGRPAPAGRPQLLNLLPLLPLRTAAPPLPAGDDPNFRGRGNRSSGDLFGAAPNIDHSQVRTSSLCPLCYSTPRWPAGCCHAGVPPAGLVPASLPLPLCQSLRPPCSALPYAPPTPPPQEFVKRDLCEWMVWLRTHAGFDGFRLDFVKGFHGSHVRDYLDASLPQFAVGEYWDTLR